MPRGRRSRRRSLRQEEEGERAETRYPAVAARSCLFHLLRCKLVLLLRRRHRPVASTPNLVCRPSLRYPQGTKARPSAFLVVASSEDFLPPPG